jgi:glycosyltransferase involved in cell wall biosynthesis
LIISDDKSSDDSIKVINEWLEVHSYHFYRVEKIYNKNNVGVSKSFNNILDLSSSEWIKFIAADDILLPDCILNNVKYITSYPEVCAVFSNAIKFTDSNSERMPADELRHDEKFFNLDALSQYKELLYGCNILAPTAFLNVPLLKDVEGANESYAMIEDYPLWLNLTRRGLKLNYMNTLTVKYRFSDSLSKKKFSIGNLIFLKDLKSVYTEEVWPNVNFIKVLDDRVMFFSKYITISLFRNRKSKISDMFYKGFIIFRPYKLASLIKRVFK